MAMAIITTAIRSTGTAAMTRAAALSILVLVRDDASGLFYRLTDAVASDK